MTVTGIVLAAGGSVRLGQPKQLLPLRDTTLLERTLQTVRECPLDQRIVVLGAAAADIRRSCSFVDFDVVEIHHGSGDCSLSVTAGLDRVANEAAGVVLFLGDQPLVEPASVKELIDAGSGSDIAVCMYRDGRGHPLWFRRSMYPYLQGMHGDKAVWKLLESGLFSVLDVPIENDIPLDVDTWDDYQALLAMESPR